MLEDSSGVGTPIAQFLGNTTGLSGQFNVSFKFNVEPRVPGGTFRDTTVRIGPRPSSGTYISPIESAMWLNIDTDDGLSFIDNNGGSPQSIALDNSLLASTNYDMQLTFDTDTNKWSGTLNGNPITANGGTQTEFDFTTTSVSKVEGIVFIGGLTSGTDTRMFVDDIEMDVIPEPGSLGFMVIASGILLLRRR